MNWSRWVGIFAGVICGLLSTHSVLSGSWFNILFWGVAGAILGFFVPERREVLWSGGLYGFFLSISFLFFGFQGSSDKIVGFAVFSLILSVVGIAGGIASVFIGSWVRRRLS
jgi:hypothetical protein